MSFALLVLALAACTVEEERINPIYRPTRMIAAAVPTALPADPTVVPQTWTPVPTLEDTPTETAVPPTPSQTLTQTPTPCLTPGQVVTGTYPSAIAGPTRNYRIYLPPCYGESNRVYPTLYMFHGNTQDDSAWVVLGLDEAAETAIQAGEIPPLIIAMPDGGYIANNSSGGPHSFEGVILDEFIPFIEQTYCAWPDPEGRAIGGLSRGGYWALEIAFRSPELFVSVGGHSAALYDTAAGPDLNPQYTGLNNDLGDIRIYFDIGASDYLIPNIRQLHEDMVASGRSHEWVLNEGSHEDAYWAAHVRDYLHWYSEPWPFAESAYPPCQ
ncbi:MAG: alpha/beta hydrolase-fold protein [Candidatus Promineifilaceae bacterium]